MKSSPVPVVSRPANEYLLEGLVRVCMCCHPGDSIFEARPDWRDLGLSLSHGICQPCQERMLAGVRKEAA